MHGLKLSAFATSLLVMAPAATAQALEVTGWIAPPLAGDEPPLELGDDPVVGRQACPPLTRLNLTAGKSEELLVKQVEDAKTGGKVEWRFELRGDVYWWTGAQATGADLARYVETALPKIVAARSGGIWVLPKFNAVADGANAAKVTFDASPSFGPYVFNGAPFYRSAEKSGGLGYECVGLYKASEQDGKVKLTANKAYQMRRPLRDVEVLRADVSAKRSGGHWLDFRMAGNDGKQCSRFIDLPIATAVFWNTHKGPAANRDLRQILTQITPRGALLREGADAYGELLSGLIPKDHPGYSRQVLVRPFDYLGATVALEKLSYKRHAIDGPRLGSDGQALKLTIATQAYSAGVVEKVLTDSYVAMGISVQFRPDLKDLQEADGVLASVALDWPRADLMATFHSRSKGSSFWPLMDQELDRLLEHYAVSLTAARPDFSLLEAVHKRLFDLEPVTVIMQHKACAEAGKGLAALPAGIKQSDPDWFRRLIL